MEIKFDLDIEDWIALQVQHLKESNAHKKRIRFVIYLVPLVYLALVLKDLYFGEIDYTFIGIAIVFSALLVFYFPQFYTNRTLKMLRKTIMQGDTTNLFGQYQISWNEEGFTVIQPGVESKIKWESFSRIEETNEYIFLYRTSVSAFIIPKNKVTGDLVEFEKVLSKYLMNSNDH